MRKWLLGGVLVIVGIAFAGAAFGDDWKDWRERRGEWKEEFWDGPCFVKIESKRGEFKKEIKCKDGIGAPWQGEWKEEFRDGPCRVKIEAKHDEYKEEVKCEGGR